MTGRELVAWLEDNGAMDLPILLDGSSVDNEGGEAWWSTDLDENRLHVASYDIAHVVIATG
jgi:hypothetical protein